MCYDDPSRKGSMRYGWFSRGETNSECSWIGLSQARKELGSKIIDQEISDSLQFTQNDLSMLDLRSSERVDINIIWKLFEAKIMAISDIVNYVPAFEKCMYQAFEEFRKDHVQYMEV